MALKMKRFTSLLNRSRSNDSTSQLSTNALADSPEANAIQAIHLFCESGSNSNGGEEVLHLPVIVEAAESSPSAAAAAAQQIRRFLTKDRSIKPYVQYNAIMLVRILSDNPGPTFTRNFDKAFVSTVKEALRSCKDQSTQQILRETLDSLEVNKAHDEGIQGLLQMWRKEKGHMASLNGSRSSNRQSRVPVTEAQQYQQYQQPCPPNGASWQQHAPPQQPQYQPAYTNGSQQYGGARGQGYSRHQLPPPFELASRVEEARNTAKILMQLIQSTPPDEVMANELIKEFSERCQSAQKSMHGYIGCDSPPPDDDTLQTLIETNEQLSLASSRYQRAVLAARRAMGTMSPPPQGMGGGYMNAPLPPIPPPSQQGESLFASAPQQNQYANGGGQSLFAQAPVQHPQMNGYDSYSAPSGPPPSHDTYQSQPPRQPQSLSPPTQFSSLSRPPSSGPVTVPFSDPFADPVDHRGVSPAPLAIEPTNYGAGYPSSRTPVPAQQYPARPRQESMALSDGGVSSYHGSVTSPADQLYRRNTQDLDSAYVTHNSNGSAGVDGSPRLSHGRSPSIPSAATPVSAMTPNLSNNSLANSPERSYVRPGQPWGATPSYLGRQTSAADGLTMHGAGSLPTPGEEGGPVAEIDSHSDVGRKDRERERGPMGGRVDVAGTGGFRSSLVGRS
ncbi:hypothetical protein LTR53_002537 [Teratosphaeriaceae sp. CCFEE 6253]|nr:hypothetical protein LTR53_002537 [Teratosphaeriaceae sp. CCFEE 6253]